MKKKMLMIFIKLAQNNNEAFLLNDLNININK